MPPSTTAWARARAGRWSPSSSMATLRAPRSRARRSPLAAARRALSGVPSRPSPSPTITTRAAPRRPAVCTCVTCAVLAWKRSASSTALICPPARLSSAARRDGSALASAGTPTTSASASTSARGWESTRTFMAGRSPLLSLRQRERAADHVEQAVGRLEPGDLLEGHPLGLVGVAAGHDGLGIRVGKIVHEDVMVPDPAGLIAHDALDDPGDVDDADGAAALLGHLADDRLARGLADLHQAAGQRPPAHRRRASPAHEQHTAAVQH